MSKIRRYHVSIGTSPLGEVIGTDAKRIRAEVATEHQCDPRQVRVQEVDTAVRGGAREEEQYAWQM